MLTRCPACQTVFRVSPEQLAARGGRVRCGHCLNAFNAAHNEVGEHAAQASAEPPETPAAAEENAPDFEPTIGLRDEAEPAEPPDESEPAESPEAADLPAVFHTRDRPAEPLGPRDLADEWAAAQADAALGWVTPEAEFSPPEAAPAPADAPKAGPAEAGGEAVPLGVLSRRAAAEDEAEGPGPAAAPISRALPPQPAPAPAAERHRALGIAVGGLAMALAVQGLFLLRQPLTRAVPALREPVAALCERLGCDLPLPREAGEISIETSDLHPEPGGRGDFVLHATLKNRAGYPQAYPHVELSLTDAADKAVVRRVFSPAEWAPDRPPEAAFAAESTAAVALPFNAAGVAAVGYRVYAFYP